MSFLHKYEVNLYITCELHTWLRDSNIDFTWASNCLLGTMKLTENTDPNKYWYNGYVIGVDPRSKLSWSGDSWGKNVIIFGADMSS